MKEQRGTLQSWDDSKGFGFIQPEGGGERLFVHISVMRGDARPVQGATVMYLSGTDDKGRPRATHMRGDALSIDHASIRHKPRPAGPRTTERPSRPAPARSRAVERPRKPRIQNLWLKLCIWSLLCVLPLLGSLELYRALGWWWPLAAYAGVSVLSYLLYRADKQSAREGSQRTPENMLHLTELLGGWPGALIAQQRFRHKTRKLSYQLVFWLIVAAHQLFWADRLLLDGRYLGHLLAG